MTPLARGQTFAVRFVSHLMALPQDRRTSLTAAVAAAGDAFGAAARQLRDAATAAGATADLEAFFAALDALVAAVVSDPALCAVACDITRGLVVHVDPAQHAAFVTLYAPVAAVIPFDTLLLE